MLAETPVRTRGSDEIPESTEHPSWSIAGFALEISFWIARARNLTDTIDGFLLDKRIVLMDRDTKFCASFRDVLSNADAKPFLLPPRSPNMNAFVERFMKSIKHECLDRMIFFGEASLRRAIIAYLEHYHNERNHQELGNQLIEADEQTGAIAGKVECRERLGGLLKYYHRAA